jgi:hypothetical protein
MRSRNFGLIWSLLVLLISVSPVLRAEEDAPKKSRSSARAAKKAAEGEFVRVRRDAQGQAVALETAVVRYSLPEKDGRQSTVDLISAIHVGEFTYYEDLNRRFATYDAMLFELVAPEGFKIEEGEKLESRSAVGALQSTLKSFLGLEFQLELVDYSKPNFVHADMSPDEFQRTMKERGESFFSMVLKMMGHSLAVQGTQQGPSDLQLIVAMIRGDKATLKRLLAQQLAGMEGAITALGGADGGSTIITERNKKALTVLRRELDQGKTNVAIFYGAGHMSDMETRLLKEFGAKRLRQDWVTAWDLTTDHSSKR